MTDSRLRVGRFSYLISPANLDKVIKQVQDALADASVERIEVLDDKNCGVSVFLHGGRVDAVIVEKGDIPRPTEVGPFTPVPNKWA